MNRQLENNEYLKINDKGHLEVIKTFNLADIEYQVGKIGGKIPPDCKLPEKAYFWVGGGVKIGEGVTIGNYVTLGDCVKLGNRVTLGDDVKLGNGVKLGDAIWLGYGVKLGNRVKLDKGVTLGNRVKLGNYVSLGYYVKLGDRVKLGNCVTLGDGVKLGNRVTLADYVTLCKGLTLGNGVTLGEGVDHFQLNNQGGSKRSLLLHIKDNQVCVSVGCQCSITYNEFLERINNSTDTTKDSADQYKLQIPVYEVMRGILEERLKAYKES